MATLEELRKKLYGRKAPEERKEERGILREYGKRPAEQSKRFWGGDGLRVLKRAGEDRKTNRLLVNILIFSFVLLLGTGAYIAYEIFFVREEVRLTVAGPDGVETGERAGFVIFIKNTGSVTLSDVELNVTYPEHAVALAPTGEPKGVTREKVLFERILAGEEVKYDFSAKFLCKTGDEEKLTALIIYRPENIQSRLTKKAEFTTRIIRSPFVITFT